MAVCARGVFVLFLSACALASPTFSSARGTRQGHGVFTSLVSRSGHHHVKNDEECGLTPERFDKYEFSPCFTCFHHVMVVKGINVDDNGEEVSKEDLGTVANYWLHNGLPATHFYDTAGNLVALLWSTVLSTPGDSKEFVIIADCHDTSLWEVEGTGYSKVLGWGTLHLENNTKVDFSTDSWGNEESITEEGSGKTVIDIETIFGGGVISALTEHGKQVLPEASEDARIFILLLGTSFLRVSSASPWSIVTMIVIPLIILLCCCGCAIYGVYYCCFSARSGYEPVSDSKQMQ